MQTQLQVTDEEFLAYTIESISRTYFPNGRVREKWMSGVLLNYVFIGLLGSLGVDGGSKCIEIMPGSGKILYWSSWLHEKRVVGLIYTDQCSDWVVPERWILTKVMNEVLYIQSPGCERFDEISKCIYRSLPRTEGNDINHAAFLYSLYEVMGKQLADGNRLSLHYLFLFHPSLFIEFCTELSTWNAPGISREENFEFISMTLTIVGTYLDVLTGLQPLTQGEMSYREICNILNRYELRGLAEKIDNLPSGDGLKEQLVDCLGWAVRNNILKMSAMKGLEFSNIDLAFRDRGRLAEEINDLKKKAQKICSF